MRCPHCEKIEDKVIESRLNSAGTSIRRRRECLYCGYRFTSYEHVEEKQLMVIKRDGRREPFDIKKIERGVQRAIEKRPIPQMTIEKMLQEIEDEAVMQGRLTHEISAKVLGEMILKKLYTLDRVAYIRFASVYRKFKNVEEFINEIHNLSQLQGDDKNHADE